MKYRFYDFEVYPNWWCCKVGDYHIDDFEKMSPNEYKETYITHKVTSDQSDCRQLILDLLSEKNNPDTVMCSYNGKGYDLIILNAIFNGCTPEEVRMISDMILDENLRFRGGAWSRLAPLRMRKYNTLSQDLMDDMKCSLKHIECILGLDIRESEVDFNKKDLTEKDKELILYYNTHDVYALMYFYHKLKHFYVETKELLGKMFNIDKKTIYASTNARICGLILGAVRRSYPDKNVTYMPLPENILPLAQQYIRKDILEKIQNCVEKWEVEYMDNIITYGNGGIHSVYKMPAQSVLHCKSDEDYVLVNIDAASFYPAMLIEYNLLSRSARNADRFRWMRDERIRLKHAKFATPEEEAEGKKINLALKLPLNTTYGASGNEYLDLYDLKMCSYTCRLGQILLTLCSAMLYNDVPNLKVIQTNTDGVMVYYKREYQHLVDDVLKRYESVTRMVMEPDEYIQIYQRDVNNYLYQTRDKKYRAPGSWLLTYNVKPGYNQLMTLDAFVSAKAVQEFLINGIPIMNSLAENKNVMDFCISYEKGAFRSMVNLSPANVVANDYKQRLDSDGITPIMKQNRVIASKLKTDGKPYRTKMYHSKDGKINEIRYYKCPGCPPRCFYVNEDLRDIKFEDIKPRIDYDYYFEEALSKLDYDFYKLKGDQLCKYEII